MTLVVTCRDLANQLQNKLTNFEDSPATKFLQKCYQDGEIKDLIEVVGMR
jgi:hypothetical protein